MLEIKHKSLEKNPKYNFQYSFQLRPKNELIPLSHDKILSKFSQDELDLCWESLSINIIQNYQRGKGTLIKGFGTFTFKGTEINLEGTTNEVFRDKKERKPVFLVSKEFNENLKTGEDTKEYTPREAIRTLDFWVLWAVFFINIASGIALLSIASPMVEELGMTACEAAGMVGMIGLLNGGGRIFFASISDHIGRKLTYCIFFFTEIIAFFILSLTTNAYMFQSLVFIIVTCYGGGFSCMPSYLSDLFGNRHLSEIHGRILTAWGLAGLAGPLLLTISYEVFGTYAIALHTFSALFVVSLLIMGYIRRPV
jgi:hypothetical protein